MNSPILQILVLVGIAVFLILRLKSVLGTREGFEAPLAGSPQTDHTARRQGFEVIDGGPDYDIIDHVAEDSDEAAALAEMKRTEPSFNVTEFIQGARGAYEMILMAFERGKLDDVELLLSEDVYNTFVQVVDARKEQGLTIEAEFAGMREVAVHSARFNADTGVAEITMRFIGELSSVVRNKDGEIIEGKLGQAKRQKDIWTFERVMGVDDPNWRLVATSE